VDFAVAKRGEEEEEEKTVIVSKISILDNPVIDRR